MAEYSKNTKRIAKNAAFLYIRMLAMMLVSLFTFRKLLEFLGVDDYGTYNVVGGIVILFSFLSNAMTTSNQRYLSYHIGKGDKEELKRTFSMIINVQIVIALTILVLAESVGLWFLNSRMNFDGMNMAIVNGVYQFSILTFLIQLMQVPYTSAIISHERMAFFSYFSIGEVILRLGVVMILSLFSTGRLLLYAILLSVSAAVVFAIYMMYCIRSFESCRYFWFWDKRLFKQLTSFSGWNMLGGIGNVASSQGVNIIFNIFCGLAVNAAMGVSHQVSSAVTSLVSNIQTAFNPQIIKSYACKDFYYFKFLIFRASTISFFMIFTLGFPAILYCGTILHIWLKEVPDFAVQFSQLIIIYCMVDAISGPLWIAAQASGKIKKYMIIISSLILSNVFAAYILLYVGLSPVWVMLYKVVMNGIIHFVRVIYLKINIDFPIALYMKEVMLKISIFMLLSIPIPALLYQYGESLSEKVLIFIFTVVECGCIGFLTLLSRQERLFILKKMHIK